MRRTGSSTSRSASYKASTRVRPCRISNGKARHANEVLLEVLAVGGPVAAAAAHRRSYDQRRCHLLRVHAAKLGSVVDQLIETQREKIAEHDLDDRPSSAERQSVADADDRRPR